MIVYGQEVAVVVLHVQEHSEALELTQEGSVQSHCRSHRNREQEVDLHAVSAAEVVALDERLAIAVVQVDHRVVVEEEHGLVARRPDLWIFSTAFVQRSPLEHLLVAWV